jgi:hypothetical protein
VTKAIELLVRIPFAGFYESWYSGEVDRAEEQEVEYWPERQREDGIAEELQISERDYADLLFRFSDYSDAYRTIAAQYVPEFSHAVKEATEFDLRLRFESMTSPRFYNFETDRLFAYIPLSIVRAMFKESVANSHKHLGDVIAERHTSRSGFCSFYTNVPREWLDKPVRDWDHNELETLMLAWLRIRGVDFDGQRGRDNGLEWEIFESMSEGEFFYSAWSDCVDWKKVDAELKEMRADIVAQIEEDNPEYIAPAPRCVFTLDLFEWAKSRGLTGGAN